MKESFRHRLKALHFRVELFHQNGRAPSEKGGKCRVDLFAGEILRLVYRHAVFLVEAEEQNILGVSVEQVQCFFRAICISAAATLSTDRLFIIDNAAKFAKNGTITIQTINNHDNETVEVKIIADGTGIPEEILPVLFNKFVTKTKENERDMGLGLSSQGP
jgi:nitrogen fixation/metabolism regulation signal transduction histidine kinase